MTVSFTHKPNYFLFAHLLIRDIESYVKSHNINTEISFSRNRLDEIFQHDTASYTINLEGILNIVDEYKVETLSGDQRLVQSYSIDAKQDILHIMFNPEALHALQQGNSLITPDATLSE